MAKKKNEQESSPSINSSEFSFKNMQRSAGILLHISSLHSEFGIGNMGPQAFAFADFLARSGQTYWQMLPLNPTSTDQGNSPYSAHSSMAGNTLLISPELLVQDGLLTPKDIQPYKIVNNGKVDYEKTEQNLKAILEIAYNNYCGQIEILQQELELFSKREQDWLHDFALYMVLKKHHNNKPWSEWPDVYKQRNAKALAQFANEHKQETDKEKWLQMMFARQWNNLKSYCNQRSIQLFGDMPFYVAYDSADVWSHRQIFSINKDGKPVYVSGTPPDDFNANGQLWGMPVFNWEVLKKNKFNWWINRMKRNLELFNLLRLDHFRAFAAYWQVKATAETALNGEWINAPGYEFFSQLQQALGTLPFVAEDLGQIDEPVYKLRDAFELPGMNILQFAFSNDMPQSKYINHHHTPVSLVYTGTHDNNTTIGWYKALPAASRKNISRYTGAIITKNNVCTALCRLAYSSVSKLAILPMQDLLMLDERARMNDPAMGGESWTWRMQAKSLTASIERQLKEWCFTYDRSPQ